MKTFVRAGVAPAFLLLCLILGGASAAGFWANLMLQLIAVVIAFAALLVARKSPLPVSGRQLLALAALILVLIGVQLIPLPESLWQSLAGRQQAAAGYDLLGLERPWLPLSLTPQESIASAVWLLPAFATLLAITRLGSFRASWIAWVIALVAGASVILGALQLVGGEDSPWYIYRITNYGSTTGFFSNSNHMATLLVSAIPFLAALYLTARTRERSAKRTSGMLVILAGALGVLLVGIAINGSLAGAGLAAPVLAASLLMLAAGKRRLSGWLGAGIAVLGLAAILVASTVPIAKDNRLTGTGAQTSPISRYTAFANSIEAAKDYAPLGSGTGSFPSIYPMYEDPATVTRWYFNHVHNDYIEIALETGLPGLLIILLFLFWWGRRSFAIWRPGPEADYFARAATIASGAILAHSVVDYPLRTAAIGALFAACCALMAEPRPRGRVGAAAKADKARHLSAD